MSYVVTIPVVFPCPRWKVYEALCDLNSHPLWNSGMTQVLHEGPMRSGLQYDTQTLVAGHTNVAHVEVTRLVPDEEIELISHSGLIAFKVVYRLRDSGEGLTEVVCALRFEFRNFVLDLARPVIESMAQVRMRSDLETLRVLLCQS